MNFRKSRFTGKSIDSSNHFDWEWLLTNKLGGYASSTVSCMNTRKYHGLLVSSDNALDRRVVLQKLDEEVVSGGVKTPLSVNEYEDGTLDTSALRNLVKFECDYGEASFTFLVGRVSIEKTLRLPEFQNSVQVKYKIQNTNREPIIFNVYPMGNVRGFHTIGGGELSINSSAPHSLLVSNSCGEVSFESDNSELKSTEFDWNKKIKYRLEQARGEAFVEDVRVWGLFSAEVAPSTSVELNFTCTDNSRRVSQVKLDYPKYTGSEVLLSRLNSCCRCHLVEVPPFKTVIAGYPWFSEWSRDSLISLPGLTLVWGDLEGCESVLKRLFSLFSDGRLTTNLEGGLNQTYDFDGAGWLIDRVYQYLKYAGESSGEDLVEENKKHLSEIIEFYSNHVRGGLVRHKSGTWMDTIKRDNAVEIQALYYNSLKIFEKISDLYGLKPPGKLDVSREAEVLKEAFNKAYYTGEYLHDTYEPKDTAVRPNQLIATSLDYTMLDKGQVKRILEVCEEKLLTELGLKTIESQDPRYQETYLGNPKERELAYHNGTVWPWLIGPYAKTYVKVHGRKGRKKLKSYLNSFFRKTFGVSGLGYINEVFDAEPPHNPCGCISQAWSIAEPVRAFFEDALGWKPLFEKDFS
ncbi:MAG: amylo-alpha-1,6-glucosidase [Methanobacteriota archaeon]